MKIPSILRLNRKKAIILAILVLAAILGFNFFGRPKQAPLQFATVKKQDIKSTVSSSGMLTGKNSVTLRFKASGKLKFINVKTGDQVYAGQVLASLDTRELAINLQQAQNTLRDKQATADKVLDDIHLFQYGNGGFANVGTANETMTQRQLRTTAEVARDNAFDSIKLSQKVFEDAIIISPINGIVTQAIEVTDQVVSGSDIIAQVVNIDQIYFDAEVDESDIGNVQLGQKAEITLNSFENKIFEGKVSQIKPVTKETSTGATVILVRIILENPEINFISGLNGQTEIVYKQVTNVLSIPLEAVEGNKVIVKEDNRYVRKNIKTGISSDTDIEVTEGLRENEIVVTNPDVVKL